MVEPRLAAANFRLVRTHYVRYSQPLPTSTRPTRWFLARHPRPDAIPRQPYQFSLDLRLDLGSLGGESESEPQSHSPFMPIQVIDVPEDVWLKIVQIIWHTRRSQPPND